MLSAQHASWALPAGLLLAWLWDQRWGEPSNHWHPVAWLGAVLAWVGRGLLRLSPWPALCAGALAWCALACTVALAGWAWQNLVLSWPLWWAAAALALAIKPSFASRMLHDEVAAVDAALAQGLPAARERLARLVSRDVSVMTEPQLRETALQTLAENLNDSVVAPLFWLAVAGLPGAWVYRMANTADAMWGYRGRWEWAGKWAARADDVLSWLPARITALALLPWRQWCELPSLAVVTPSPNGGWPMAALALRLGVRLEKPGTYCLNPGAPSPGAAQVPLALATARRVARAVVAFTAGVLALRAWAAAA